MKKSLIEMTGTASAILSYLATEDQIML